MNRYSVSIPWYASVIVEVEAEDVEEAKWKAINGPHPSLCWRCSAHLELNSPDDSCEMDVEKMEEKE